MQNKLLIELDKNNLPFIFIIFLVLMNALFNSLSSAYGFKYPFNTFLFNPQDLHADLIKMSLVYLQNNEILDTSFWPRLYQKYYNLYSAGIFQLMHLDNSHMPPLSFLLGWIVSIVLKTTSPSFLTFLFYYITISIILMVAWKFKTSKLDFYLITIGLFLSYPMLFVLTRGNIFAFINAIALMLFIYSVVVKRNLWLAAIALSISMNIRPNTLIMAILFFSIPFKDAVKYISLTFLIAGMVFFLSLWGAHAVEPYYTLQSFFMGLKKYIDLYVVGGPGVLFNNSLFGMVKTLVIEWQINIDASFLLILNKCLTIFGGILLMIALYIKRKGRLSDYEFAFVIMGVYVLTTTVISVYHLIPFAIFLLLPYQQASSELSDKYLPWILMASIFMLIPKNYFFIHLIAKDFISIETVLNPLLLLSVTGYILTSELKSKKLE